MKKNGSNGMRFLFGFGILAVALVVNIALGFVWFRELALGGRALKSADMENLTITGILMCLPAFVVYLVWFLRFAKDRRVRSSLHQHEIRNSILNFFLCVIVGVLLELLWLLGFRKAEKLPALAVQTLVEALVMSGGLFLAFLYGAPKMKEVKREGR